MRTRHCLTIGNPSWQPLIYVLSSTKRRASMNATSWGYLLDVVHAPIETQGVFEKKDIAVNDLYTVPLTTSITFKEIVPKGAMAVATKLGALTLAWSLPKPLLPKAKKGDAANGVHLQTGQEGFVAHFWMTPDADVNIAGNAKLKTPKGSSLPVPAHHQATKAGAQ